MQGATAYVGRKSLILAFFAVAMAWAAPALAQPPQLVSGDEPVVVTRHEIRGGGRLRYEARAGRLPIRHDETGEVRGRVFFTAYVVPSTDGRSRPVTFFWNGGPTVSSLLLHTEMFGPRRLEGDAFVDNVETLLTVSDLVFYDPVGTGFSRPEAPRRPTNSIRRRRFRGDRRVHSRLSRALRRRATSRSSSAARATEPGAPAASPSCSTNAGIDLAACCSSPAAFPARKCPIASPMRCIVPARTAAAFHHRQACARADAATVR